MKRIASLSSVVCSILVGCGGGAANNAGAELESESYSAKAPSSPVHESGGTEVTATFGPPGGTLELQNGVRVEIPSGTVEEATDVVLKVAPITTVFKNVEFEKTIGPAFLVTPELSPPEGKTLVVSIPFGAFPDDYGESNLYLATEEIGNEQRAFGENSTATRWEYRKVKLENGRAVAALDNLSGMRLQFVLSK
jgi:hypothetical protein